MGRPRSTQHQKAKAVKASPTSRVPILCEPFNGRKSYRSGITAHSFWIPLLSNISVISLYISCLLAPLGNTDYLQSPPAQKGTQFMTIRINLKLNYLVWLNVHCRGYSHLCLFFKDWRHTARQLFC